MQAWKAADRFEGRSSVAILALPHRHQRVHRHEAQPPAPRPAHGPRPRRTPDPVHLSDVLPENTWITPIADEPCIDLRGDPAEVVALATPSGSPSCPPCSASRAASVPRSCCAMCCAGPPPRSPNCSTRQRRRSTVRCSVPEQRWPSPPHTDARRGADRRPATTPRALRRRLRALRHGRPRPAPARRRHPDHAAVRHVAARARRRPGMVGRTRRRMRGLETARRMGQRLPSLRPVPSRP